MKQKCKKCERYDRMTLQTTKYEPRLMDHIFCSGNSRTSRWIRWYNRTVLGLDGMAAEMSHVASIWQPGTIYECAEVFESTSLNEWSAQRGVQLNYLDIWLSHYDGDVYAMRVTEAPIEQHLVSHFVFAHLDDDYESGLPGGIELALTGFRYPQWWPKRWRRKPTKEPHCSEIIVQEDQELDILDDNIEPHKFPPGLMWQHFEDKPYWQIK